LSWPLLSAEAISAPFWEYFGPALVAKFLTWEVSLPAAPPRKRPFHKDFLIFDEEAFLLLVGIKEGIDFSLL